MTDTYLDLANRREVYLSRFASYLRNEYTEKNLDEVYKQVRLMLLDAEEILSRTQLNELTKAIELAVLRIQTQSLNPSLNRLSLVMAMTSLSGR